MLKVKEMIILNDSIQLFCIVTFFYSWETQQCRQDLTQAENHNTLNSNSCFNASPDLYKILSPITAQVSWYPRLARIFKLLANAKILILRDSLAYMRNV